MQIQTVQNDAFVQCIQLCLTDSSGGAFCLQPATNHTENCWHSVQPLGQNTLSKALSGMCGAAGIPGFKTNCSLQVTAATRLYRVELMSISVMEWTGHRRQRELTWIFCLLFLFICQI